MQQIILVKVSELRSGDVISHAGLKDFPSVPEHGSFRTVRELVTNLDGNTYTVVTTYCGESFTYAKTDNVLLHS